MTKYTTLISIIIVLIVVVPALLAVAYATVAERKTMASMQRRLGPNIVGYWGSLQAFADALKLLLKEYVSPTQANIILFFLGPIITLTFSLLGYGVVPYGPGLTIWDFDLGILYMLAVSSLATYGILLAGWSANSKYAFLGALRSTAQLISYELILSSAILLVILLTGSLALTVNVEFQRAIWFTVPLLPIFIIFFIGSVAETNRPPFDLAEAESELVSGFMTEHAAVIFVFFFLAEYGSIVLICILNSILFLGGYLYSSLIFTELITYIFDNISVLENNPLYLFNFDLANYPVLEGLLYGSTLGVKTSIMVFTFIWVRASFPRIRYDQLMTYSWTVLLPIVIAFIILVPAELFSFDIIPTNFALLFLWPFKHRNEKPKHDKSNESKIQDKKFLTIPIKKWYSFIISGMVAATISISIRYIILHYFEMDIYNIIELINSRTGILFIIITITSTIRFLIKDIVETLYDFYLGKPYLNTKIDNTNIKSKPYDNSKWHIQSSSENLESNNINPNITNSSSYRSQITNPMLDRANTPDNTRIAGPSSTNNIVHRGRLPIRNRLSIRDIRTSRSSSPDLSNTSYRNRSPDVQAMQRSTINQPYLANRANTPISSFYNGENFAASNRSFNWIRMESLDIPGARQWQGRNNRLPRLLRIIAREDDLNNSFHVPVSTNPRYNTPPISFWAFIMTGGVYNTGMSTIPYTIGNRNGITYISDPTGVAIRGFFNRDTHRFYPESYQPYINNLIHYLEYQEARINSNPRIRRPLPVLNLDPNTREFLREMWLWENRHIQGRGNYTRFRLNNRIISSFRNLRNRG